MTPWWRDAIIYQIYPRSFADTDGDGVGDLRGVLERLDHVAWLGVDALWLTPVTPSPNADWGYDVSDYRAIHPALGTLDDLDALLEGAHARGLRVLLDLVPNHTSDQHPWFLDARSGRTARHRDWYVWADPAPDGGPPNNWLSLFGGVPAWTLDDGSGQYYLHSFLASQPDLNWWSDGVRAAFDDILRFWLDRGVDGFRVDVAAGMVKDRHLRDNPPAEAHDHAVVRRLGQRQRFNMDRPEVHDVLRRWRAIADGYPHQPVLLGEAYVLDAERLLAYYGNGADELHLAFDFLLMHEQLRADALRRVITSTARFEQRDAWPALAGSNHDAGRLASRWAGSDDDLTRCALMLLLFLRGTPVLYYGDELGLPAVNVPPTQRLDSGFDAEGLDGRDGSRTPMPWHGGPGAGFTRPGVQPWLPLGDDAAHRNVASQRDSPDSNLWFIRDLITLRRQHAALRNGGLQLLDAPDDVLAWRRGNQFEIWLNLGATTWPFAPTGTIVASTRPDAWSPNVLQPRSGIVVTIAGRQRGRFRGTVICVCGRSATRSRCPIRRCRRSRLGRGDSSRGAGHPR
jgi:alpha-glucosidase